MYSFIRAATAGWSSPATIGWFAAAAFLLTAFVAAESRVDRPLLLLGLLAVRSRAGGCALLIACAIAVIVTFVRVAE